MKCEEAQAIAVAVAGASTCYCHTTDVSDDENELVALLLLLEMNFSSRVRLLVFFYPLGLAIIANQPLKNEEVIQGGCLYTLHEPADAINCREAWAHG